MTAQVAKNLNQHRKAALVTKKVANPMAAAAPVQAVLARPVGQVGPQAPAALQAVMVMHDPALATVVLQEETVAVIAALTALPRARSLAARACPTPLSTPSATR
jgi:hypothetical protein